MKFIFLVIKNWFSKLKIKIKENNNTETCFSHNFTSDIFNYRPCLSLNMYFASELNKKPGFIQQKANV